MKKKGGSEVSILPGEMKMDNEKKEMGAIVKQKQQTKKKNKAGKHTAKKSKRNPHTERERGKGGRARVCACVCVWVVCAHEKTKQGKQTSKQKPFKVSARKKKKKK